MSSRPALPAGLRLDARKTAPLLKPLLAAPAPRIAVLALDQGSGEAAEPLVAAGTRVGIGTPIARAVGEATTDLHSPVAGVVFEIAARTTVAGVGRCILIENDATDARDPALAPVDWRALDGVTLLECLRGAGIAGLGGAAQSGREIRPFAAADQFEKPSHASVRFGGIGDGRPDCADGRQIGR